MTAHPSRIFFTDKSSMTLLPSLPLPVTTCTNLSILVTVLCIFYTKTGILVSFLSILITILYTLVISVPFLQFPVEQ